MVTEPGHFRVLMKSESATNSSLGIVTVTPLGETATYWPVESDRDIARFSICRVRLAGSADGGKTFLSRQTFVSVINLCILAWPVKFRSSFTAKQNWPRDVSLSLISCLLRKARELKSGLCFFFLLNHVLTNS